MKIKRLFLLFLVVTCDALAQQQPWHWQTPSVTGVVFETKEAAAAALRASALPMSILTIEQGPEVKNNQLLFTYTAPDVAADLTPWNYIVYELPASEHPSEGEAKAAMLAKVAANSPSNCSYPAIVQESNWLPYGYFYYLPPIANYTASEQKLFSLSTWVLNINGQCQERISPLTSFRIRRMRRLACQAPEPFQPYYVNYYNKDTGQGNIWACYYPFKGEVYGHPLLQGCEQGNPCNVRNGDKSQAETDYRGATFSFTRHYHSLNQSLNSDLGIGWSHSFSDRLSFYNGRISGVFLGSGYQIPLTARQGGTTDYQSSERPAVEVRQSPEGWVLYAEGGRRDTFDAQGRLLRREGPNGQKITLVRDPVSGRLQQILDAAGRALTFTYDATSGRLTSLTDPAGGITTYSYTGGLLTQVSDPDQRQRRYLYEDSRFPHALTGILDETGTRYSTYTYDALGRVATSEHSGGAGRIALDYVVSTSNGSLTTTVTNALNQQTLYTYLSYPPNQISRITRQCPTCGNGLVRSYTYNSLYPTAMTDERGIRTTYVYDTVRGLETRRTEAAGTAQARTIATQWHPTLRLPVQITEPHQRTDYTYDGQGNLLSRTETALDTQATRTWRYTYDAQGNRLSEDGPRDDVADLTTYTYWPLTASCPGSHEGPGMDQGCRGQLQRQTDPAGQVTEYLKYNAHGQLLQQRNPNGAQHFYTYDARQRLISRQEAGLTTTYRYDPRGLLEQITLPSGAVLTYAYDAAHRLIGLQDNAGNRTRYTLDAAGNRLQEQRYDPTNTLARQITREFDALSRLQRETWGVQP